MKKLFIICCFLSITTIHSDVELTREEYILLCNEALYSIGEENRTLMHAGTDDILLVIQRQTELEKAKQNIINLLNKWNTPANRNSTIITITQADYDNYLVSYINP